VKGKYCYFLNFPYAHNFEIGPPSESLSLSEEDVMGRESSKRYSTT